MKRFKLKKLHRLSIRADGDSGNLYGTICGVFGVLNKNDIDRRLDLHTEDKKILECTVNESLVTCTVCARVVIGLPGIPQRRPKPKRKFRSRHLTNALHPLGLLRKTR